MFFEKLLSLVVVFFTLGIREKMSHLLIVQLSFIMKAYHFE